MTVTVPESQVSRLVAQIVSSGLNVMTTTLRGAFHDSDRFEAVALLMDHIDSNTEFHFLQTFPRLCGFNGPRGEQLPDWRNLHRIVAQAMLVDQANWQQLFATWESSHGGQLPLVIAFGRERCLPQSLVRQLASKFLHVKEIGINTCLPVPFGYLGRDKSRDDIAVVGMACNLPGSSDLNDYWRTILSKTSQHTKVPEDRVNFRTAAWREADPEGKWFGNFIEHPAAFDHKFFKKSPREAASTDPQQRIVMQLAYQALEQSGYFSLPSASDIGCYIGVGLSDYEHNVACHSPTAYSATGNLKSFVAGKVSHFFGWTGPGVTIDTACSSSAVAIHNACQAILNGECSAALAGGTNMITGPEWYQNLAGASFLSSTGQCKPFDAGADGYCRGEGAGVVFLKRLSSATRDGNQIFGIINATAVFQNENCSVITAPSGKSLADLFSFVTRKAGLEPREVSVVEAHGTGTQIGDRAEYHGVRTVFGGAARNDVLSLGSVKGLIGHTETSSGVAALIKVLLMLYHNTIPPQASHNMLNPKLEPRSDDNIEVSKTAKPWLVTHKVALINNYGASGSNASLVVSQPPAVPEGKATVLHKVPFWLSAFDEKSLNCFSTKLSQFLQSTLEHDARFSISNLSFQLCRQSNRTLGHSRIFSCATVSELREKLIEPQSKQEKLVVRDAKLVSRPVILCFGGQVSTFVGLDRKIYDQCELFRSYLDHCNDLCVAFGYGSLYPDIFSTVPANNTVRLQTMQFALQYSSAMSWIASGVKPTALIGHSFGDLTAMCVSGVLSLENTIVMIAKRAQIIQRTWGADKGRMVAVDGEHDVVQRLVQAVQTDRGTRSVGIACYNGPRNFTLAGSTEDMQVLQELAASDLSFSSLRLKQLNVTNAFHSSLVDGIMKDLLSVGEECIIREAKIEHEKATKESHSEHVTPDFVARHLRDPVHFNDAVQRLAIKYPSSIWLEAGSNSGVTNMAKRALGSPSACYFQPVNLTTTGALSHLVEATTSLWLEGLDFTFWLHHVRQMKEYKPLVLPPYQFDISSHWIDRLEPPTQSLQECNSELDPSQHGLLSFMGYQDTAQTHGRFRVNTISDEYRHHIEGHVIAQTTAICPSALQHAIVIGAASKLVSDSNISDLQPELQSMHNHVPICIDESRALWLDVCKDQQDPAAWQWTISSTQLSSDTTGNVRHAVGRVVLKTSATTEADIKKYERLIDYEKCLSLLAGLDADQILQGSNNIYKIFQSVVDYQVEDYKLLRKIVAKPGISAGRIAIPKLPRQSRIATNEAFCQVAGIYLNCMIDREDDEMFLANKVDSWMQLPKAPDSDILDIYALNQRQSSGSTHISDIFVFHPSTRNLVYIILGLEFTKVKRQNISKLLTRLSGGHASATTGMRAAPVEDTSKNVVSTIASRTTSLAEDVKIESKDSTSSSENVTPRVRGVLCKLLGLDDLDIKSNSDLIDLGVDSLLAMEVAREIEDEFGTKLTTDELMNLVDFQSLVDVVRLKLGMSPSATASEGSCSPKMSSEEASVQSSASSLTDEDEWKTGNQETGSDRSITVLPTAAVLETFRHIQSLTDSFVRDNELAGYNALVQSTLTDLCVAYIVEAFEKLGSPIRNAKENQILERIPYLPKHEKVVGVFYNLLADTGLIKLQQDQIMRTSVQVVDKSAATILAELRHEHPAHTFDLDVISITGSRLADCLSGKAEGIQLLMSPAGREQLAGWYQKAPVNAVWINQLEKLFSQLFRSLEKRSGPINILEIGAGTGGTTSKLVSTLAALEIPFCYTATDISSSLVAGLRKRFKHHHFMRFKTLDVEKTPTAELMHSQHIVLATNCVHATHDLAISTRNIRDLLASDGFLVLLEMTQIVPWVDLVWGLVDGWWLANDGRQHALCSVQVWDKTLRASGFGHVDWTGGDLPESSIQRLIVAFASTPDSNLVSMPSNLSQISTSEADSRQVVVNGYVNQYTELSLASRITTKPRALTHSGRSVLVTGGTGSLGSHIVAYLASRSDIQEVICLNRISNKPALDRQQQALKSRSLLLDPEGWAKVRAYETETHKDMLGLSAEVYEKLVESVTDIIHNAWPMSLKRSVKAFEPQFRAMANLISFARHCASTRIKGSKIGFEFISSVAVVGHHPFVSGESLVPETQVTSASTLPIGYADAKLVCENMLQRTLHRQPDWFKSAIVRLGQIAGSRVDGYWNPAEHIALLLKSSQSLRILPDLHGVGILEQSAVSC